MKKISFFLNCAASAMFAIALTACNATEDNPTDPSLKNVTIQSGDTLSLKISEIAEKTAGDEIFVEIPAGLEVFSGTIDTPAGKKVTIVSDANNPAKVIMTGTIYCANAINVKNLYINAAKLESNVFAFTKKNADETLKNEKGQYQVPGDAFVLDNVIIDSISSGLLYDGGASYVLEKATINNSILQFTPAQNNKVGAIYLNSSYSGVIDFTISNSTVYTSGANALQYFIKFNNSFRADRIGVEATTYTLVNNTFATALGSQFANHTGLQRYVTFTVKNNIFNFEKNLNQVIRGICGNSTNLSAKYNASIAADNNCYVWNGEFKTQNYNAANVNNVEVDPQFRDAAEGNFRPTNLQFLNLEDIPGDPRWTNWLYKGI